jgi:hypothetical protein
VKAEVNWRTIFGGREVKTSNISSFLVAQGLVAQHPAAVRS